MFGLRSQHLASRFGMTVSNHGASMAIKLDLPVKFSVGDPGYENVFSWILSTTLQWHKVPAFGPLGVTSTTSTWPLTDFWVWLQHFWKYV